MGRKTEKREFVTPDDRDEIEARFESNGAITLSQDGNVIAFEPKDIEDLIDLLGTVDPRPTPDREGE